MGGGPASPTIRSGAPLDLDAYAAILAKHLGQLGVTIAVEPGTAFEDIPDDWVCPECGVEKDMFEPVED